MTFRAAARGAVAIGVAAAVLLVTWYVFVRDTGDSVVGLGIAGTNPFSDRGSLPPGPARAIYSPDGSRVAVLHAGRVDLAAEGGLVPITRRGGNVVDAAWFSNGSTLLVAEGPAPTGGLAVVDIDGTVRGTVRLTGEQVAFGGGHGMSVAPDGKSAVLTAVLRSPFGEETRHLVRVTLESGSVEVLTPAEGSDEFGPRHLDDGTIVHSTPGDVIVGIVNGTKTLRVDAGRLVAGDGSVFGEVPPDVSVVDVARGGDRAIVVERGDQPQLREIRLSASGAG